MTFWQTTLQKLSSSWEEIKLITNFVRWNNLQFRLLRVIQILISWKIAFPWTYIKRVHSLSISFFSFWNFSYVQTINNSRNIMFILLSTVCLIKLYGSTFRNLFLLVMLLFSLNLYMLVWTFSLAWLLNQKLHFISILLNWSILESAHSMFQGLNRIFKLFYFCKNKLFCVITHLLLWTFIDSNIDTHRYFE